MASCASYRLIRFILFRFPAEFSHRISLSALKWLYRTPMLSTLTRHLITYSPPALSTQIMGIQFSHPVGLAAGLDKNAECVQPFTDMGFAFIELGTVTPRAQSGNPSPRLFRLVSDAALINRMGFNNVGVQDFLKNLSAHDRTRPIGINMNQHRQKSRYAHGERG